MTRRERMEQRLERRLEWAAGRRLDAAREFAVGEPFRGDIAFNTQPGHFPLRARVIRAEDRGAQDMEMAGHHERKAEGLEHQLETTIFSDDPDAIEALRAKIAALETEREMMTRVNAAWRKAGKPTADLTEAWAKIAELVGCSVESLARIRVTMSQDFLHRAPYTYALTNLGGNIRRLGERSKEIEARTQRTTQAETSGGILIQNSADGAWVQVTFAQKPERGIIQALKTAGFRWGAGYWSGLRSKLPAEVRT